MTITDKAYFLQITFFDLLLSVDAGTPPTWGKMNVQQMVEHLSEYVRMASGGVPVTIVTDAERIPRMQEFLMSEKPFRENTPNVLMPDVPPPAIHATLSAAIDDLRRAMEGFFSAFSSDTTKTIDNPFFGSLNFEQQIQLLHKHTTHHLRQFGITDEAMGLK